ncbi:MAG: EscS/YscS/HrcS family type III secretion system export apparatus protein [Gammaproteobacteria bacterium]|nr:MAG: EscS/YscS/HrcS family type III secretion system export apparatus protein [Gammaproteobacteria bacterium]
MIDAEVIKLTQQALWLVLLLATPPVLAAAVTGLVVALIQAATQLQEQTVQYALKFFAIVLSIFLTMALTGATLYQYSDRIFSDFPSMVAED